MTKPATRGRYSCILLPVGRRGRGGGLSAIALGIGLAGLVSGCSASPESPPGSTFVAYARDFSDFRSWPSQSFDSALAQGATHVGGPRTVYINAMPTAGAIAFPVGTMIVKVTGADGKIFARAKRGGGYNRTGAVDWEWFELEEGSAGLKIGWRGFGPPVGEMYGGDPNSGCNSCHRAASANDYVLTPTLNLGTLGVADGGPESSDSGPESSASPDGGTDVIAPDDGAANVDGGVEEAGQDG